MERQQHVVIVPVKPPSIGKSRLRVPDDARTGLAAAFALDVLAVARSVPSVAHAVVMTGDDGFARVCSALGHRVLPDGADLNHGLRDAATVVRSGHPDAIPVAVCADLPCLTAADLAAALAQVTADGAWFVADAGGEGTTLYAAPYAGFAPRFGVDSRAAHEAAGARPIRGSLATLRRDVDDETDLAEAVRLGPGRHTREALALLS